jgi:hypothetical protein
VFQAAKLPGTKKYCKKRKKGDRALCEESGPVEAMWICTVPFLRLDQGFRVLTQRRSRNATATFCLRRNRE